MPKPNTKNLKKTCPRPKVDKFPHVDKLTPYNQDVKYHLVAFDCFSRYL